MESDSTQCDSVCEGENTLMCGGKSKSSVFAMHMCASTKEDLGTRSSAAGSLKADMDAKGEEREGPLQGHQSMGEALQASFGQVGDSGAAGLAQGAKVFAGKVVHKAEDADETAGELGSFIKDVGALKDFTDPATVTKAERVMEGIDETMAAGELVSDELDALTNLANPEATTAGAAKQYYAAMYFVDKEFDSVPMTCSGDSVAEPIVGKSEDGCATACDANIHSCVGFQYFKKGDKETCFLFSKFSTGFYYT